jgi:hypothetical protein
MYIVIVEMFMIYFFNFVNCDWKILQITINFLTIFPANFFSLAYHVCKNKIKSFKTIFFFYKLCLQNSF